MGLTGCAVGSAADKHKESKAESETEMHGLLL